VLIVDDHDGFRSFARALLDGEGFEVVGEAEDASSALAAASRSRPTRWRRRLLWSALALVVVVAVVFVGGGWYFAGQIRSGALAVEPAAALPAYDDVRVVAV
jgi:CheY-like chemotaxis protein